MLIQRLSEREITREGGAIPRVQDRDKEALAMQKSGNNVNNHWSFKYNVLPRSSHGQHFWHLGYQVYPKITKWL